MRQHQAAQARRARIGDGRPKARVALGHLNPTATWFVRPGARVDGHRRHLLPWFAFSFRFRPCHGSDQERASQICSWRWRACVLAVASACALPL